MFQEHPHCASAHATTDEAAAIPIHETQNAFASVVGPGCLQPLWVTMLDFDYNCGPAGTAPSLSVKDSLRFYYYGAKEIISCFKFSAKLKSLIIFLFL